MKTVAFIFSLLMAIPAMGFDEAAFIAGDYDDTDEDAVATDASLNPSATPATETSRVSFYGRFENQLSLAMMKDGNDHWQKHLYDYLFLRLDMDATLSKNIVLKSDVVARLFAGDTEFAMDEVVPPDTVQRALQQDNRLAAFLDAPYAFENRYWLDNAYVKLPIGDFLLTLGKQPLGQGAGYVWNPTDVFTQKELLDPTYQQEGIIAARLGVPMGKGSLDMVLASPDDGLQHWVGGGRLTFNLGSFQFSGTSWYTRTKLADVENAVDAMEMAVMMGQSPEDALPTSTRKRVLFGGDMVVDIEGVRLWGEGAYNYLPSGIDWVEAEGGLEYYFSFETHLMVEYFYYGRGPLQQSGSYSLNSWMNTLEGNYKMLGRHFAFESIEHPVADYWSVALSSFQGFSDGSAIVEADVKWDFAADAQLWLMAAKGFGGREDFLSNSFQSWLRMTLFY